MAFILCFCVLDLNDRNQGEMTNDQFFKGFRFQVSGVRRQMTDVRRQRSDFWKRQFQTLEWPSFPDPANPVHPAKKN